MKNKMQQSLIDRNGEGEIKSHSTTEVIEPYRKHFESN